MTTAVESLLKYLSKGKSITTKQVQTMFKVDNPSDLVYRLRNEGHAIRTTRAKRKDGTISFSYELTKPSKQFLGNLKRGNIATARKELYIDAIRAA